jgi:acyl-coenzyme A synthetase/AMP-(fatty) acid ligase
MPADTVIDRLQRHAQERPGAPALVSPGRTLTYRELHALVGGCAEWLRSYGIERGERVGLSIADDLTHYVVMLALASLGAAHATLATHDSPAARARFASRVGARRVVATQPAHALPGLDLVLVDPARMTTWSRREPSPLDRPDPSALFTFFTTSGTTGEAKIIPILHGRLVEQFARAAVGRFFSLSALEHHFVKRVYLYTLIGGNAVAIRGDSDLPTPRLCAELGVELLNCMNAQAGELVSDAAQAGRLPPTTTLLLSGARGSAQLRRQMLERVCDAVAVTYSMQECGSIARIVERGVDEVTETVGRPHPGVDIEIVDASGAPVYRGETGALRVRVPGMATGYLDDERATAAQFRDGWFEPGDLVSFTPGGALIVHGRADDVINLNGIKVAPVEIERALERHPAVKAVAAFPMRSVAHGEIPVAAVELADGMHAGERELQRFARDTLGVRAPRRVMIVAALPATPQGKIDRARLAELVSAHRPEPEP